MRLEQFNMIIGRERGYNDHLQIILHKFVDLHNCRLITASVAVIGGWEDSHDVSLVRPVVAIHDELMGASNARQVIRVVELLGDVLTKTVAGASWWNTPAASVIGVGPQKIADRSLVGRLLNAIELTDLIEGVNAGWQTTMQAEDLVLNDSCERQIIEELRELFPHVGVAVLAKALIIEAVPN